MSDEDKKVVSLVEYRGPRFAPPDKANPAIPDHIWERFQSMGAVATEHLARLLTDPRFPNFSIKEQMKIIETTFQRAYGSPDGSVRRHIHAHVSDPEADAGFNALTALSRRAQKNLPEYKSPHVGDTIEGEAVPVRRDVNTDGDG